MTSPSQWTWFWETSRRWWRTRKPGMLQSMGLQRVGHDWVTEQHNLAFPNLWGMASETLRGKKKKTDLESVHSFIHSFTYSVISYALMCLCDTRSNSEYQGHNGEKGTCLSSQRASSRRVQTVHLTKASHETVLSMCLFSPHIPICVFHGNDILSLWLI